jgi:Ca-activated chloride channel family protein
MLRFILLWSSVLGLAGSAEAHGILIPKDPAIPPLAMINHQVRISLEDQVAMTQVEQTFRNHTSRQLEAIYVFPVPRGASVNKFTMWINGKETGGELVEAAKARQTYEDIVRRTLDPGLLEYMDSSCLRLRVFPIPPHSDQKVALRFMTVARQDTGVVEYVYPLKSHNKIANSLADFSIQATIKSQHALQNIYSPTHAISIRRQGEREAVVTFERKQSLLDKDFQLFYATGDKDVGFTVLMHRPISSDKGYCLMLLAPRNETSPGKVAPRDLVFVLDTSGSMQGSKIEQARRALNFCLDHLNANDRFALMNFATTVNQYQGGLIDSNKEQIEQAKKWVNELQAVGGTAINDALAAALALRKEESGRTFTIVFFTDGEPTVGVTDPQLILKNVAARNSASTRIFTFGVGDEVNATLLDQLAEQTRAVATYVRPAEDIEAKVSSLVAKISHPVVTNLKLTVNREVHLDEIYPPQLPDLFQGEQLVVLGRYTGAGSAAITLSGSMGGESREFVHELTFADKTDAARNFVEHLWARRKVGYLLDQVRANGEKKELVDEIVSLAKKYGIATPYTSYLIVPDAPMPLVRAGGAGMSGRPLAMPGMGMGHGGGSQPASGPVAKVADFASQAQRSPGQLVESRDRAMEFNLRLGDQQVRGGGLGAEYLSAAKDAKQRKSVYEQARSALQLRQQNAVQAGKLGVDLSIDANRLRRQSQLAQTALQRVAGRNCLEVDGVWIDEGFNAKMPKVVVKAMSAAYFRLLEKQPQLKEVFQLGNYLVWVTPSGTALIIDTNDGTDQLSDEKIDTLFK